MVGKQGDYTCLDLRRLLDDKSLSDRCRIVPFQLDIAKWYEAIDILVAPSENEAFGRNIVEAMERETIVVAANSGGHKELVVHGKTGYLVKLGDILGYVETIKNIVNSGLSNNR